MTPDPWYESGWFLCTVVAFLVATFGAGAAEAGSPDDPLAYYGFGGRSCGAIASITYSTPPGTYRSITSKGEEYTSASKSYQEWLQGFVSAINFKNAFTEPPKKQITVDLAGMDLWVRNWCEKNPTADLMTAALAMVKFLKAN